MLVARHKLKRDYIVSYEYVVDELHLLYNQVFYRLVKNCQWQYQAFEQVADAEDLQGYRLRDWYVEPVLKTHQDRVSEQVYQLVLAELFVNDFGLTVEIDDEELDDYEIETELEGLEKLLTEHQAQIKFDKLKGE